MSRSIDTVTHPLSTVSWLIDFECLYLELVLIRLEIFPARRWWLGHLGNGGNCVVSNVVLHIAFKMPREELLCFLLQFLNKGMIVFHWFYKLPFLYSMGNPTHYLQTVVTVIYNSFLIDTFHTKLLTVFDQRRKAVSRVGFALICRQVIHVVLLKAKRKSDRDWRTRYPVGFWFLSVIMGFDFIQNWVAPSVGGRTEQPDDRLHLWRISPLAMLIIPLVSSFIQSFFCVKTINENSV